MGTAISVEIVDGPEHVHELIEAAFAWFREVDERFSTYKEDSEVRRVDRGELRIDEASADLRTVLHACERLRAETNGYFDAYAGRRLDPSGYVKGWSVQVASDRLAAAGAGDHCVNAGGDIRLKGLAAEGEPWRVGIRHPWEATKVAWVVAGTDLAIATSGTYERGLHVLDPYRGVPATFLRSVTVTGPDLALADAYATAAMAMGERGPGWLAGLDGYACAVVTEAGEAFRSEDFPLVA
ncbi:MAG TPA: FAD:protein FMN transferase [Micromonosporaceae bacterium]